MKKLIPILMFAVTSVLLLTALVGWICMLAASTSAQLKMIAVPISIIALVGAMISTLFAVLFKRDKLCFISVFIALGALTFSCTSVIVWLCAL